MVCALSRPGAAHRHGGQEMVAIQRMVPKHACAVARDGPFAIYVYAPCYGYATWYARSQHFHISTRTCDRVDWYRAIFKRAEHDELLRPMIRIGNFQVRVRAMERGVGCVLASERERDMMCVRLGVWVRVCVYVFRTFSLLA